MSRPTVLPIWTTGDSSQIIQPPAGQITTGWLAGEAPPFRYMNWWMWLTGEWVSYLDSSVDHQIVAGSAQATNSAVTSTTFADFSNNVTLTFTPTRTAKYEISCQTTAYPNVAGANQNSVITINASGGTPFVIGDVYVSPVSSADYKPIRVFLITTLTAGVSYTFKLQGKIAAGQINLDNSHTTSGSYMVAKQL